MGHTPWVVERTVEIGVIDGPVEVFEIAEAAEPYADFNVVGYAYSIEHADTIIAAVNSYQAMKEALEQSKDALCWMYGCIDDEGNIYEQYQDQMSVALEKVEKAIDTARNALTLTNGEDKES